MTLIPLDKKAGTEQAQGLSYAEMPLGGERVELAMELFLPKTSARPAPLLVWLGPDCLTDREVNPTGPRRLADFLTRNGVAMAMPAVRVGATRADLPDALAERLAMIEPKRDKSVDAILSTFPAVAATQDICALLARVSQDGGAMGLSGQTVLAGAGIGAGLAFNVAIVSPHLGLSRPDPVGVISYSGTCAWPSLFTPDTIRAFALHNPTNRRIPIGPIRVMAARDPSFELIEGIEQAHASLGLWPQESMQDACRRLLARVQTWCGL